ncbi:MAG: hypothetical protein CL910_21060 [Deltaproteobacteria bacterium]|nr:hypothetical protein [Deltaproteobacteria bacterium]
MEVENASTPLAPALARTLYNAAQAEGKAGPEELQRLGPAVEAALRHGGVAAARRAWLALRFLEWRPLCAWPPGRPFSRLALEDRRAWLARLARGPLGSRALRNVRHLLAQAAPPTAPSSQGGLPPR